jgi:hypothetical protein
VSDDILWLAAIVIAAKAWEKYQEGIAPALQQGGAAAYEMVHPSEQQHRDDLPGHQWKIDRLIDLAADVGFPEPELAAAIAMAESGGVPNALTKTDREESVGLWQINLRAWPMYSREQMSDPVQNANAAYKISRRGTDWTPWSVYKSGRYLRFM